MWFVADFLGDEENSQKCPLTFDDRERFDL